MTVALLLVGCASSTMEAARTGAPTARLDSHKTPDVVAQCIQFSWQEEKTFGVDASGYLEARKAVVSPCTREAESFVDVYAQAGGTRWITTPSTTTAWPCSAGRRGDLPVGCAAQPRLSPAICACKPLVLFALGTDVLEHADQVLRLAIGMPLQRSARAPR
jgi:hypothetical protein